MPSKDPHPWDAGSAAAMSAVDAPFSSPEPAVSGPSDARYVPGAVLGQGGMGRVVSAWDPVLEREVARKEVAAGAPDDLTWRLWREARLTAGLEHPGIVPVYDAGLLPDGRPFYAMRVIRGRSLADVLRDLPLADRLAYVRHVRAACEAVAYAHTRGVLHRDLKPANVLVGGFGETQVADWGLGRQIHGEDDGDDGLVPPSGTEVLTRFGAVVGTPGYMSPEAARGEPLDVRADVWGLGTLLRELLTGRPPDAPPAPTLRLQADAPPELATIADKALAVDRDARYPTAQALADDVGRWLDGQRVHAHAYTARELVFRAARRYAAPIAVALAATLVLAIGAVASTRRILDERDRAERALADADQQLGRTLLRAAVAAHGAYAWPEAATLAARALTLGAGPEARGVLLAVDGAPTPERIRTIELPPCDRRAFDARVRWLACLTGSGVSLWGLGDAAPRWTHAGRFTDVGVLSDGAVVVSEDATLTGGLTGYTRQRWLDAATGAVAPDQLLQSPGLAWDAHDDHLCPRSLPPLPTVLRFGARRAGVFLGCAARNLRFVAHDGAGSLAVCADAVAEIRGPPTITPGVDIAWFPPDRPPLQDPPERLETWSWPAVTRVALPFSEATAAARTPEGWLFGDRRGALHLRRDAGDFAAPWPQPTGPVVTIHVAPHGRAALITGDHGQGFVDPRTGAWLASLPGGGARALTLDGDDVAWITRGDRIEAWRLTPGLGAVLAHPRGLSAVVPHPTDGRVAVGGGGGILDVWSADGAVARGAGPSTDRSLRAPPAPDAVIKGATWVDGELAVALSAGSDDGCVVGLPGRWRSAFPDGCTARRVGQVGGGLWWASYDTFAWVQRDPWDAAERQMFDHFVHDVSEAPEGLALLDDAGRVSRVDVAHPEASAAFVDVDGAAAVARGGGRIAAVTASEALVYDDAGAQIRRFPLPDTQALDAALSPDGRWLAVGDTAGRATLWGVDDGALLATLPGHAQRVASVRFVTDAAGDPVLWTAGWDGLARRYALRHLDERPEDAVARVASTWHVSLDDAVNLASRPVPADLLNPADR